MANYDFKVVLEPDAETGGYVRCGIRPEGYQGTAKNRL